jgi:hypothetical protein
MEVSGPFQAPTTFNTRERAPGAQWIGWWVRSRYSLAMVVKKLFNPLKLYLPSTLTVSKSAFCIYWFCMILAVNSNYFLEQH